MKHELSSSEQITVMLEHMNTLVELMGQELKQIDADLTKLSKRIEKVRNDRV
jgi:tRNA(Phe) wybutosine-synthesizing methylase Tyw3